VREGHWFVDVSGKWRLLFAFEGEDAVLVDFQDYHCGTRFMPMHTHLIQEASCGSPWEPCQLLMQLGIWEP
jgi:hypothetical protein